MSRVAIIGAGILGTSIAYFLAGNARNASSVTLIEQEQDVSQHTSSRNTGKVHAPFLYDPEKKKLFAKAAALGFEMWEKYAKEKRLLFKRDGVLEVATDEHGLRRLDNYMSWGRANGLSEKDLQLLDKTKVSEIEPNVRCEAAILCTKDGSVDYGSMTRSLLQDLQAFGCTILLGSRASSISYDGIYRIAVEGKTIEADYIVNAAGGNAMDIAHSMGIARQYTDLHFRGEYWQAPEMYQDLTRLSIYSVPKHPEYPFLDPHWIVRVNGRREVGPNAVPVFGPHAYSWGKNLSDMIPKMLESSRTGARKIFLDRKFIALASTELKSSLSKTAMINRVREFLPQIRASRFTKRGTCGIRSSVVDSAGRFVPDTMIMAKDASTHVLNYNSPGATGALPMAAMISSQIINAGFIEQAKPRTLWDAAEISAKMA